MRADYLQWATSAISALTIKNLETEQSASLKVINVHGLVFSLCSAEPDLVFALYSVLCIQCVFIVL